MEQTRYCVLCHKEADLICQRCRDPYCSSTCQKIDWPHHKATCFPMPMLVRATSEQDISNSIASSPFQTPQTLEMPMFRDSFTNDIPHRPLVANKENNVNTGNYPKSINVEKFSINDKSDGNNSKTMHFESQTIDGTEMRKCKITAVPTEPLRLPNKPIKVEAIPPMDITELEKSIKSLKIKEIVALRQVSEKIIEKPNVPEKAVELPKAKENIVEKPKVMEKAIEVTKLPEPKPKVVESKVKSEEVTKLPEPKPKAIESKVKSEIWMKSFPMEENKFESVAVQFVSPDKTVWVMLEKNEGACNQLLREINKTASKTPAPDLTEIKVNSIFSVPFEGIYYRAIVLEPVSANDTVLIRLIDYGNEITLPITDLKSPISVMGTLMAYSFPIKFRNPRKVDIGDKLKIKMDGVKDDVMIVIVEGETPLITMKDIEMVPIPIGEKQKLFCLDFSNMAEGYISASVYDKRGLQQTEIIGEKITNHCKGLNEGYTPKIDELCLALFEDGQWYRAVVAAVKDANTFDIIFIDYGNIITVKSSSIRKMSDEFMHKCLMNKCYIKGFPKKPTNDDIGNMAVYFNNSQIFEAKVEVMENGTFMIETVF